jgi:hypothetical protein
MGEKGAASDTALVVPPFLSGGGPRFSLLLKDVLSHPGTSWVQAGDRTPWAVDPNHPSWKLAADSRDTQCWPRGLCRNEWR